jgi:hypothetical protein
LFFETVGPLACPYPACKGHPYIAWMSGVNVSVYDYSTATCIRTTV